MLGIYHNRRSLLKYIVNFMDALIYYSAKKRIPYPSELKDICIFLASNWND